MISFDVDISHQLMSRLTAFRGDQREIYGSVFGWFASNNNKKTFHCVGVVALDSAQPFGYSLLGAVQLTPALATPQDRQEAVKQCHEIVDMIKNDGQLDSDHFVFLSVHNGDVKARAISMDYERSVVCNIAMEHTVTPQCVTLRVRTEVPFQFEMSSSKETLRSNIGKAVNRLKQLFDPETLVFVVKTSEDDEKPKSNSALLWRVTSELSSSPTDGATVADTLQALRRKPRRIDGKLDLVNLNVYLQRTGDKAIEKCGSKYTPVITYKKREFQGISLTFYIDLVCDVTSGESTSKCAALLSQVLRNQATEMAECIARFARDDVIPTPEVFHFLPPSCGHWVTMIYPKELSESELAPFRREIHKGLILDETRPFFKRLNRFAFPGEDCGDGGVLRNPHVGLTPPGKGQVSLVYGNYLYYHYMQQRMDDNGWGCAYRSLQTIISWFRLQGYTDVPVPTHKVIQETLVAVGDKKHDFIGSRQWIGSQEVSYVLHHLLKVDCKTMYVRSGSEMTSKARELQRHFETQGTPIMIGGGQLAHTILGVSYDADKDEAHFLILDPHYTGGEDLAIIQKKGWCGWKGANFWTASSFYNMCLPQRPFTI